MTSQDPTCLVGSIDRFWDRPIFFVFLAPDNLSSLIQRRALCNLCQPAVKTPFKPERGDAAQEVGACAGYRVVEKCLAVLPAWAKTAHASDELFELLQTPGGKLFASVTVWRAGAKPPNEFRVRSIPKIRCLGSSFGGIHGAPPNWL